MLWPHNHTLSAAVVLLCVLWAFDHSVIRTYTSSSLAMFQHLVQPWMLSFYAFINYNCTESTLGSNAVSLSQRGCTRDFPKYTLLFTFLTSHLFLASYMQEIKIWQSINIYVYLPPSLGHYVVTCAQGHRWMATSLNNISR